MRLVISDERGATRLVVESDGEARYQISGSGLRDNRESYGTDDDLHVVGLVLLHLSAYNSQEYLKRRLSQRDRVGNNSIPLWEQDEIQFPRLLSEILATIEITNEDWASLRDSMDLEDDDLQELFDRAQTSWERIKRETT